MGIPGTLFRRTEKSLVILLRSPVQNALGNLSPLHQPARVLPARCMLQALEAVCVLQVPGQPRSGGTWSREPLPILVHPLWASSSSLGPTSRCLGSPSARAVVSAAICFAPIFVPSLGANISRRAIWGESDPDEPLLLCLLEGKRICMLKWTVQGLNEASGPVPGCTPSSSGLRMKTSPSGLDFQRPRDGKTEKGKGRGPWTNPCYPTVGCSEPQSCYFLTSSPASSLAFPTSGPRRPGV